MGLIFSSFSTYFIINLLISLLLIKLSFKQFDGVLEYLCCFNPYFSYLYVIRHLYLYERSMILSLSLRMKVYQWTNPLINVYGSVMTSIVIYWIFIWYIDKINPGEYGIPLKWKFPFHIEYWKSSREYRLRRSISNESICSSSTDNEQLIVQIKSLTKYYSSTNRYVLRDVSLNFYQNQITALLGPNGAGRFSSLSIQISFAFFSFY